MSLLPFLSFRKVYPQRNNAPRFHSAVRHFGGRFAILVRSFVLKETLFYKSVRRVHRLFVFLPLNAFGWQK
ncbi:hypothetical protein D4M92_03175 [Klebsiella michiganensis]|nr:hypothetical protein D4M92_03175 [Klebsiella michiganensis]